MQRPPTWQNPVEISSEYTKTPLIAFEMISTERDHFLHTLKTRGQVGILLELGNDIKHQITQESKVTFSQDSAKQSLSQGVTLLEATASILSPEVRSIF